MEKIIYVVKAEARGDGFDGIITFDKDEAIGAAIADWDHLTRSEKNKARISVAVFNVTVNDGETAEQAYIRLLDDDDPSLYNWQTAWDSDDIPNESEIVALYYIHTNAYDALLYRNDEIGTYKSLKCDGSDSFPILGEDEEAASEYLEEISDFYWNISGGDELTKKEFLDFIDDCDPFEHPENRHNLKIVASLIIREN